MIFGPTAIDEAVGAILAHGTKHAGGMFKKGRVLSAEDVAALREAGVASIIAARLGADDVPEDEAARRVSLAACGAGARPQEAFTGRANLYSSAPGLLVIDEARVRAVNRLHESLTLAMLPNHSRVSPRQMVATIKVIPFAVPRAVLEEALAIIGPEPLLKVAAFAPKRAGLVITQLPQTKPALVAKSEGAIRERLVDLGASLGKVVVCPHQEDDVRAAVAEMKAGGLDPILVFGASAIVDRADVIPAAVTGAGGQVLHLGMPVDPGNLLMLGRIGETPVVGVPSCARSPKVNGFDWVLERLVAGLPVSAEDLMDMGLGGLLAEIPSRPTPRAGQGEIPSAPRVAVVVLAAGTSSRMGAPKMLADFHGQPMIRATVTEALASSADEVVVVTGHRGDDVAAALAGLKLRIVPNPHFAEGLSSSIRAGVAAVAGKADCVVIHLGDMPLVRAQLLDRLIAAYNPVEQRSIVVPTFHGQFGNPVLWGAEHFGKLTGLDGDRGARTLIASLKAEAVEIEAGSDSVLRDADTPEALEELRRL